MKRFFITVAVIVTILLILPSMAYGASEQWAKYSGNPVVRPSPGAWDSDYTTGPRVLHTGGEFRMWYSGGNKSGGSGIGYATSLDGFSWTKLNRPVLVPGSNGAWDSSTVAVGSVTWNGTVFTMYYRGTNPTTYQTGAIGFATSIDGVSWTKYSGNPIIKSTAVDQTYIGSPFVVKLLLSYDLWYTGKNFTYQKTNSVSRILLATSLDGIKWNKWPTPVFLPSTDVSAWDSASVYSPSVYWNGTIFWLWYSGVSQSSLAPQIGLATSPDGSTWTRFSSDPILSPGSMEGWDSAGVEQAAPVINQNSVRLYYDGLGAFTGGRIGLAQSPQGFAIPEFPYPSMILIIGLAAYATALSRKRRHPK